MFGRSLPLQIGWKEKLSTIDAFFERHETLPYKFDIDSKRNVFIVEMEGDVHSMLAMTLSYMFNAPNGGILLDPPIQVSRNTGKIISTGLFDYLSCHSSIIFISTRRPLSSRRWRCKKCLRCRSISGCKRYSKNSTDNSIKT